MRELRYEYAAERDGEEIAALLEETEFSGGVSLAYGRRPNAVLSLAQDGEHSAFVIARNPEGRIVGVGGCVINGVVAYLTGLRAVSVVNIPKAYGMIHDFCIAHGVKLTYTTILEDNVSVQRMLEKNRGNMPRYLRHSRLTTHIIRKNLRIKDKHVLAEEDGFMVLRDGTGQELARGQVTEHWSHKQCIVKKYGWQLRLLKPLLGWMPEENEELRFFTLRAVTAADSAALESFLRHASRLSLEGAFFVYGGADCPVRSIRYKSIVYIVDWDKTIQDAAAIPLTIEVADL